ncbi:MAG TPA: NAD(P) transhydrogenase subunit alpha [Steroidobacteraceae bacterium]|nr:NAD(P) transhydrogenase subunit alpha [Steroidobacteraceae bacterium]
MPVTIGVLRETVPGENRVAIVPEVATRLAGQGARILVERGAGAAARYPDAAYKDVSFADSADVVIAQSDVLLTVQPPDAAVVSRLKPGAVVAGFLAPHAQAALVRALKERRVTSFAMELVPRISRAQSMDALSSQAAVAGYKAVLIGAAAQDKFFPMLTTAAGTIRPATVLVIGAGVAGLQAIATAKRLGAIVEAYDVRAATREQVKSLGAKFVETGVTAEGAGGYARELTAEEKTKQQAVLDGRIAAADCVITTAGVPGRPAPRIITRAAVERMKPGAVVVDLLAENGGNCELSKAGETVEHGGVRVIGPVNLPATVAHHASEMYAKNLLNFLKPALKDGAVAIDWNDEVFAASCVTHEGAIRHEPTRKTVEAA